MMHLDSCYLFGSVVECLCLTLERAGVLRKGQRFTQGHAVGQRKPWDSIPGSLALALDPAGAWGRALIWDLSPDWHSRVGRVFWQLLQAPYLMGTEKEGFVSKPGNGKFWPQKL